MYVDVNSLNCDKNVNALKVALLKNKTKEVRKLKREEKASYYNLEFNKYKKDIKKTKSRSAKQLPGHFVVSGIEIKNKVDIANHFNNFFINNGPQLASKIDSKGKPGFSTYLQKVTTLSVFKFTPINEDATKRVIRNLKPKKSMGVDCR